MSDGSGGVRQTIILAAGVGARLERTGAGVPKPLLAVAGLPLIAHALSHAQASGCREALVVVGFQGARVRSAIEAMAPVIDVRFVVNPDPTTPNGDSLLVAEPHADDRFFLQMVDHLFARPVLDELAAAGLGGSIEGRVLVDRRPVDLDLSDATKVRLDGDRVTAIGKGIEPWDAIDAGCFVLGRTIFDDLRAVAPDEARTVSSAMRRLVARGALAATELQGVRWIDVDTPADLADAESLIAACTPASPLTSTLQ